MKIFSGRSPRPPLSRQRAWVCLLLNALVCPGLGSLMARRFSGLPQLVLAWGGGIWMMVVIGQYTLATFRFAGRLPEWRPYVASGLGGMAFFLAGWVWSIGTGLLVLWRTPASNPPPPTPAVPPEMESPENPT